MSTVTVLHFSFSQPTSLAATRNLHGLVTIPVLLVQLCAPALTALILCKFQAFVSCGLEELAACVEVSRNLELAP